MAIEPSVSGDTDHFLLNGYRGYQLNLTRAICIGPGEPQQLIHGDDFMFNFVDPELEAMINTMWAVDDFTEENGATHVVPGSHKWPLDRLAQPHEEVQGVMKAGSVLVWLGSLQPAPAHRRRAQLQSRLAAPGGAAISRVSRQIATQLPERLQKLLGYFVHEPNLGSVEGQDPIGLLRGGINVNGAFTEFLPAEVSPC